MFILLILLSQINFSTSSSLCSRYYSLQSQSQLCECEDMTYSDQSYVSLKCIGASMVPKLLSHVFYDTIEFEACVQDLNFQSQSFSNLTLRILRIRHCNVMHINDQTFSKINQFEKFYLENSTILSLDTMNENFQDVFSADSFENLRSLTLKNIHYHQPHVHDKKLNLELLLKQLPHLYRLELTNILLDNYRYHDIDSIGQHLTYLSLTNTHQKSLLPIKYLESLERLLIRQLPHVFQSQPLILSLKNLKRLKYIVFEQNGLYSIENLQSNTIDDIDLSSNLIETINEYTFEHVPKLRHLTLTGNPLRSIDKNAFCGIENLQRLSIKIQHTQISPLDNCILLNYPNLHIIQESQTKLQCDCLLMNIFNLKSQPKLEINRSFKMAQVCLFRNDTYQEKPVHLHELENYLNCSSFDQCNGVCQYRTMKSLAITPTMITEILSSYDPVKQKSASLSTSLYSFYSYLHFLLLLCSLYL